MILKNFDILLDYKTKLENANFILVKPYLAENIRIQTEGQYIIYLSDYHASDLEEVKETIERVIPVEVMAVFPARYRYVDPDTRQQQVKSEVWVIFNTKG